MNQVFISYSRKDKAVAGRLHEDLEFRGISAWIDLHDIPGGKVWAEEIEKAILESPFFLLLLSPHSVTSEHVRKEYTFAIEQTKTIVPLLLERCEIPDAVKHLQYIDFREYEFGLSGLMRVFPPEAFNHSLSVDGIIRHLQSTSVDVRLMALSLVARAAYTLGELKHPDAIPPLVETLYDGVYDVRSNAGWALVYMGQAAVKSVISVLRDTTNRDAQEMAYQILLRAGGDEANDAIQKYWK